MTADSVVSQAAVAGVTAANAANATTQSVVNAVDQVFSAARLEQTGALVAFDYVWNSGLTAVTQGDPNAVDEQLGEDVGGTIGSVIGAIYGGVAGAAVGNWIGGSFGLLVGSAFGPSTQSVGPNANAWTVWNGNQFVLGPHGSDNGGSDAVPIAMANQASDALNGVVKAVGGTVISTENMNFGFWGNANANIATEYYDSTASGNPGTDPQTSNDNYGYRSTDPSVAVQQGVWRVIENTEFGGAANAYAEQILIVDRNTSLGQLQNDLGVAAAYAQYEADPENYVTGLKNDAASVMIWNDENARAQVLGLGQTPVSASVVTNLDAELEAALGGLFPQAQQISSGLNFIVGNIVTGLAPTFTDHPGDGVQSSIADPAVGVTLTNLANIAFTEAALIAYAVGATISSDPGQVRVSTVDGETYQAWSKALGIGAGVLTTNAGVETSIVKTVQLLLQGGEFAGGDVSALNAVESGSITTLQALNNIVAQVSPAETTYLSSSLSSLLTSVQSGKVPQAPPPPANPPSPQNTTVLNDYQKILGRTPTDAEYQSALTVLNTQGNATLVQQLFSSTAYQSYMGNNFTAEVDGVYQYLNASPAYSGNTNGTWSAALVSDFFKYNSDIVFDYQTIFGRAADPTGYVAWAQDLQSGDTTQNVKYQIFIGGEYYNANHTNESGEIATLYAAFLKTAPTPDETAYYENLLGTTETSGSWDTVVGYFKTAAIQQNADPLVIGAPGLSVPALESIAAGATFNDGVDGAAPTGWTSGTSGFLVANTTTGGITQITQMLPDAQNPSAANTFTALSQYADANGMILPGESGFNQIEVWKDSNGNGRVDSGELTTLSALGITSISAVPTVAVLDDSGNLITLESTYTSTSGNGVIAQVSFPYGGPDTTVPAGASTGSNFTDANTGVQVVLGDGGSDRLTTSGQNILLDGNGGINVITDNGGSHNDLYGGAGQGTLITSGSYDLLQAVSANDLLIDNAGNNNVLDAGAGDSVLRTSGTSDTLISHAGNGVMIDTGGTGNRLYAGSGNEWLITSGSGDTLAAGTGNDILLDSGHGNTLVGGSGLDTLASSGTGSTLIAGTGATVLATTGASNTLIGGSGNNILMDQGGSYNTLADGTGNSTLSTTGTHDLLMGGAELGTLTDTGGSYNTLVAGSGSATLTTSGSQDYLCGGSGADTLIVQGSNSNTLYAGTGTDLLSDVGGSYNTLIGNAGQVTLITTGNHDVLSRISQTGREILHIAACVFCDFPVMAEFSSLTA